MQRVDDDLVSLESCFFCQSIPDTKVLEHVSCEIREGARGAKGLPIVQTFKACRVIGKSSVSCHVAQAKKGPNLLHLQESPDNSLRPPRLARLRPPIICILG